MTNDFEKMEKAKNVLLKIAKGINPVTGEEIPENNFICDARIIQCFYFVTEVLDNVKNGVYSKSVEKQTVFIISSDEKTRVTFPDGKIGVNEFSKQVNQCIDLSKSKKLTGVELNKRLKNMGILSERVTESGKTRTIINESSANYGFEMEKRKFNGVEYEMVVMNDKGKRYLLEDIEKIMSIAI